MFLRESRMLLSTRACTAGLFVDCLMFDAALIRTFSRSILRYTSAIAWSGSAMSTMCYRPSNLLQWCFACQDVIRWRGCQERVGSGRCWRWRRPPGLKISVDRWTKRRVAEAGSASDDSVIAFTCSPHVSGRRQHRHTLATYLANSQPGCNRRGRGKIRQYDTA